MASFNVRCYYNTGFNSSNIPDSHTLIDSITNYKDYDAVWILQSDISTLKIKSTWNNVQSLDYCKIFSNEGAKYYFVIGVQMLNENTAQLSLQFDALTSVGIANFDIINGWCTRRHVSDDSLFKYNLSEDFVPSEPDVLNYSRVEVDGALGAKNNYIFIATTVKLEDIALTAKNFVTADEGYNVTVPVVPPADIDTTVRMEVSNSYTPESHLPGTTLYCVNENTTSTIIKEGARDALGILRALGLNESITASYIITYPKTPLINGNVESLDIGIKIPIITMPKCDGLVTTDCNYKWSVSNYTIKNNKVFSSQFNRYTLANPVSGDEFECMASQIAPPAGTSGSPSPKLIIFADPSPNGRCYCRFNWYEGNDGNRAEEDCLLNAVKSLPWINQTIIYGGASGALIADELQEYTRFISRANQGIGVVNGLNNTIGSVFNSIGPPAFTGNVTYNTGGSIMGRRVRTGNINDELFPPNANILSRETTPTINQNITGVPGAILGGAINYANQGFSIRQQEYAFQANQRIVNPEVTFPRTNNLQGYFGCDFVVIRKRLSNNDSIRFDKYLTAYGYAVSEPLTKDAFTCRQYFNFVQATDVNIAFKSPSDQFGIRTKQQIIEQLSNGVRIWHVLPNSSTGRNSFNNNPIVTSGS